jgi:hypothetical protein
MSRCPGPLARNVVVMIGYDRCEWHMDTGKHEAWMINNNAANRDPEKGRKLSKSTKPGWADAGIRKKRVDGMKNAFSDKGVSQKRKDATAKAMRTPEASANMIAGHSRAREAKLAKLPPHEREKKRADLEKRRVKAREKYRAKHGITHRVVA